MSSEFWTDVTQGVKKGWNNIADATGSLVNKGKDAIDKTTLEYKLSGMYRELGKTFHNMVESENLDLKKLQNSCNEISDILMQIKEK